MIERLYKAFLNSTGVSIDTRTLNEGEIFFALSGENFDGNVFAQSAISGGASCVVASDPELVGDNVLIVSDCLKALQELALHHRNRLDLPVIAITGSNGKTTTKELIHHILSTKFKTVATKGNLNNHIGVPLSLLNISEETEIAVIEIGANHIGEVRFLSELARPTHGLITNIGKAHLEGFGSLEGVKRAKSELYENLESSDGVVFVNLSADYLEALSTSVKQRVSYAVDNAYLKETGLAYDNIDYLFSRVESDRGVCLAWQISSTDNHVFESMLYGAYNAPNIATAVTVGLHFGVDVQDISKAIKSYVPVNNRSQVVQKEGKTILLDAYNANPVSMELAIADLSGRAESKSLILGGMNELGEHADVEHLKLLNLISQFEWCDVLLIGPHFKEIHENFDFLWFADARECRYYLEGHIITGEVVLLKGSRSLQLESLLDFIK